MYHYAGNNPIRYVDPDGRTAKNATAQYVVIRLEGDGDKSHYMILAPGDFSVANCDGFIFSSSNIGKVSAKEEWGDVVNFTILGECFLGVFASIDDLQSVWTNVSRDVLKVPANIYRLIKNVQSFFKNKEYESFLDYSGSYRNQKKEGAALNGWWEKVKGEFGASQEDWKQRYETDPVQKELQKKYLQNEGKE